MLAFLQNFQWKSCKSCFSWFCWLIVFCCNLGQNQMNSIKAALWRPILLRLYAPDKLLPISITSIIITDLFSLLWWYAKVPIWQYYVIWWRSAPPGYDNWHFQRRGKRMWTWLAEKGAYRLVHLHSFSSITTIIHQEWSSLMNTKGSLRAIASSEQQKA